MDNNSSRDAKNLKTMILAVVWMTKNIDKFFSSLNK